MDEQYMVKLVSELNQLSYKAVELMWDYDAREEYIAVRQRIQQIEKSIIVTAIIMFSHKGEEIPE